MEFYVPIGIGIGIGVGMVEVSSNRSWVSCRCCRRALSLVVGTVIGYNEDTSCFTEKSLTMAVNFFKKIRLAPKP